MTAAFGSADDFSKNIADVYYKLTDQQEKAWGHDGELLSSNKINTVAPFAFFTASNHESDFYALADIANANRMKFNIDTDGEAWACEHKDRVGSVNMAKKVNFFVAISPEV